MNLFSALCVEYLCVEYGIVELEIKLNKNNHRNRLDGKIE